jgi:hypothetical protein
MALAATDWNIECVGVADGGGCWSAGQLVDVLLAMGQSGLLVSLSDSLHRVSRNVLPMPPLSQLFERYTGF